MVIEASFHIDDDWSEERIQELAIELNRLAVRYGSSLFAYEVYSSKIGG
jgi:hypothetical protein